MVRDISSGLIVIVHIAVIAKALIFSRKDLGPLTVLYGVNKIIIVSHMTVTVVQEVLPLYIGKIQAPGLKLIDLTVLIRVYPASAGLDHGVYHKFRDIIVINVYQIIYICPVSFIIIFDLFEIELLPCRFIALFPAVAEHGTFVRIILCNGFIAAF